MDEFERADRDDYLLDRADEHEIARVDWALLHGMSLVHPTLEEAIRQEGMAKRRMHLGTELILEEEFDDG